MLKLTCIFLFRQSQHIQHYEVIENFRDKALQMGKEVTIKLEGDATLEDV